ncbi:hypothetical protein ABVT39_001271, partial [Epinephelus coioides]
MCAYRNSQSGGGKQSRSRMPMQMKVIALHGSHRCAVPCRGIVCAQSESLEVHCSKCNTQAGHSCKYSLIYEGRARHNMSWMLDLAVVMSHFVS